MISCLPEHRLQPSVVDFHKNLLACEEKLPVVISEGMDDDETKKIFAARVSSLRLQFDVSQEKLAKFLRTQQQNVQHWENARSIPRSGLLKRLAAYFGTSVSYLLGESDMLLPVPGDIFTYPPASPQRSAFIFSQVAHLFELKIERPFFPPEWEKYKTGEMDDRQYYIATRNYVENLLRQIRSNPLIEQKLAE